MGFWSLFLSILLFIRLQKKGILHCMNKLEHFLNWNFITYRIYCFSERFMQVFFGIRRYFLLLCVLLVAFHVWKNSIYLYSVSDRNFLKFSVPPIQNLLGDTNFGKFKCYVRIFNNIIFSKLIQRTWKMFRKSNL